jgi:hypothetical protein
MGKTFAGVNGNEIKTRWRYFGVFKRPKTVQKLLQKHLTN